MRIDYIEGSEYWTAKSFNDLHGWRVFFEEPWTEAVSRLHCLRDLNYGAAEFRFIYCRTLILKEVIEVEAVQ